MVGSIKQSRRRATGYHGRPRVFSSPAVEQIVRLPCPAWDSSRRCLAVPGPFAVVRLSPSPITVTETQISPSSDRGVSCACTASPCTVLCGFISRRDDEKQPPRQHKAPRLSLADPWKRLVGPSLPSSSLARQVERQGSGWAPLTARDSLVAKPKLREHRRHCPPKGSVCPTVSSPLVTRLRLLRLLSRTAQGIHAARQSLVLTHCHHTTASKTRTYLPGGEINHQRPADRPPSDPVTGISYQEHRSNSRPADAVQCRRAAAAAPPAAQPRSPSGCSVQ